MMKDMFVLLRSILEISTCQRRFAKTSCGKYESQVVSKTLCKESLADHNRIKRADSSDSEAQGDALKSTDASGSEEQATDSFDGSESDNTDIMPNSEPTTGESDCSDAESSTTDGTARAHRPRRKCTKRLNQSAATVAPSTIAGKAAQEQMYPNSAPKLRESIRAVINALEQWEASTAAEEYFLHQQGCKTVQNATSLVLQEALSKLAPDDVAMVTALVDSKLASDHTDLPDLPYS